MKKTIINSTDAPDPVGAYNQAVRFGDTLYISGQIGIDPKTSQMVEGGLENETKTSPR